ncbi:hypothetical protein I4U23_012965 [Adineta vaga]|nr:hypothetical protein I4U23_012965 [Adineta vaga]
MATRFSPKTLKDMTKSDLIGMVKFLQVKNADLQLKVEKAEHAGRHRNELLQQIRQRCEKHRKEKNRLEQLDHTLYTGYAVSLVVTAQVDQSDTRIPCRILSESDDPTISCRIPAFDEHGVKHLSIQPKYLSTNFTWAANDKTGSILTGILRFGISLPSQITFPAPHRSFAVVTLFAVKLSCTFIGVIALRYCLTHEVDLSDSTHYVSIIDPFSDFSPPRIRLRRRWVRRRYRRFRCALIQSVVFGRIYNRRRRHNCDYYVYGY